ncbi:hypothetical protein BDY21DRAFT_349747, partial [Lineolata rhizophorae]
MYICTSPADHALIVLALGPPYCSALSFRPTACAIPMGTGKATEPSRVVMQNRAPRLHGQIRLPYSVLPPPPSPHVKSINRESL